MPRLSEEVPNWDELPAEDRELYHTVVRDFGLSFLDGEEGDLYG